MLISWNDHFALGIDVVDTGHGLVIEAINQLNEATTPADSAAVAGRMLPLLLRTLPQQFAAESALLAGLPAELRATHEGEHHRFLDTLDFLHRAHLGGNDASGPLLLNLVCFLVSHLRATDLDSYAARRRHHAVAA
ncbi:MAG: hypothetical protein ACM31D_14345 [Bacteroidota bacterium]